MNVKWIKKSTNTTCNITEFVESATWGGSVSQAARTLEISVLNSPYDKNITDLGIKLGDRLKLYDDNHLLIDVMVYSRERNSQTGTITYSGYDNLNYLLKSNGTYNFKNTTPEKITEKICNELKVDIGKIVKTNVNIKKLLVDSDNHYNILMKAYTKAHKSNGKKYMPIMSGTKLSVIEKGEIIDKFVLDDKVNVISSSYSENLDSMINRVKIYNDKGKQIGEVNNADWIKTYGVFQDVYTKEDGINATTAAKNLLTGLERNASIEAIGNVNCVSGYGIKIKDSITGLTGTFWIENDSHSFQNNIHTMSLELSFRNIMDEQGDS